MFENQNGVSFEIQFQTPESQAVKELKIPIYNERRKKGISDDRAALLDQRMHDLAEQIPDPKDIEKIKTRKRDSNGTENARNKKNPDETIFQP